MHEIDGLVRYAKATRASRSPPQGIQPQICCNLRPLFAAYLRLYMNQRTEASARPGETPIRPRESTGNWYTTANLLQSTGPNCSIFAVVYESGERSTHMTQEKLCLPCLPCLPPRHPATKLLHLPYVQGVYLSEFNGRPSWSAYSSRRASMARESVTSSTKSSSPPTGMPLARRVTVTSKGLNRRAM